MRPQSASQVGAILVVSSALLGALSACTSKDTLYDVAIDPTAISPDGDGNADVARISYAVGEPSLVTITLRDGAGNRHYFREDNPRSPGRYEALFGGVVDGRMLPDGQYVVEVTAVPTKDESAEGMTLTFELAVSGGDTTPPELVGFVVDPSEFTPNQDGLGDRVAISYRLDEPAEVRLWLERADGEYVTDILEEKESADFPGEPGPHVYDFDAGVDADAPPPPDGDYFVVGRAQDAAGNVTTQRLPLAIRDGGQPRVALLGDVDWSDTVVPLGHTLTFSVTVANVGDTPVRTRGPAPGFVYDNISTFNQVAPPEVMLLAKAGDNAAAVHVPADRSGVVEVSMDFAGTSTVSPSSGTVTSTATITICGEVRDGATVVPEATVYAFEGDGDNGVLELSDDQGRFCLRDLMVPPPHERTYARSSGAIRLGVEYDSRRTDLAYPYRWQLGDTAALSVCQAGDRLYLCLPPGETATVTGGIRFVEAPFGRETRIYVALMHEDVRKIQGPYGQQRITIEY
jgi:hypothetical protein